MTLSSNNLIFLKLKTQLQKNACLNFFLKTAQILKHASEKDVLRKYLSGCGYATSCTSLYVVTLHTSLQAEVTLRTPFDITLITIHTFLYITVLMLYTHLSI